MTRSLVRALAELARRIDRGTDRLRVRTDRGLLELGTLPEARALLEAHVYERVFVGWKAPVSQGAHRLGITGSPAFVAGVASACEGTSYFESGWRVTLPGPGWAFVSSGVMNVFVTAPDDLSSPLAELVEDQPVALRLPCLRENLVPHFLYVIGRGGRIAKDAPFFKFYLNVEPSLLEPLVRELFASTSPTNALRFELKAPNHPDDYGRFDAVVVYTEAGDRLAMSEVLCGLHRRLPRAWRSGTPPFTHRLKRGLAIAESPSEAGEAVHRSYGQVCAARVTTAILESMAQGRHSGAAWAQQLAIVLCREGVDPRRPYVRELSL